MRLERMWLDLTTRGCWHHTRCYQQRTGSRLIATVRLKATEL
jgi:hypothetical protein